MHIQQLLSKAGIRFQKFPYGPAGGVFLTAANQLAGSYTDLQRLRAASRDYLQWQPLPVVDPRDLERLGAARVWLPPEQQACVLLPERAQLLLRRPPAAGPATPDEVRRAYGDAYARLGNYCGGGVAAIRQELLAIAGAAFRLAGVA